MRWHPFTIVLVLTLIGLGCDSGPGSSGGGVTIGDPVDRTSCRVPQEQIRSITNVDAIPALTDPELVEAHEAGYLKDDDRVLGLHVGTLTLAVPHRILWSHEIVNLNTTDPALSITYCPLTGSGLAFQRDAVNGAAFGVSGLLFNNNLVMYDRRDASSLWPQMATEAVCGPIAGATLTQYPLVEMTWAGWRSLYPETQVLSLNTGFERDYHGNPYRGYDTTDRLLYDMPVDRRRPLKELVLGLPAGQGGTAYPFGELDDGSPARVIPIDRNNQPHTVVFWDRARQAAAAFVLDESLPTEFIVQNDRFVDTETGSVWQVDGVAAEGPLAGRRLQPVQNAYVAYWFAWAAFQPETAIWTSV